jgi:hypothetical protein
MCLITDHLTMVVMKFVIYFTEFRFEKLEVSVRNPEVSVQKPEVSVRKLEVSIRKPEVSKYFNRVSIDRQNWFKDDIFSQVTDITLLGHQNSPLVWSTMLERDSHKKIISKSIFTWCDIWCWWGWWCCYFFFSLSLVPQLIIFQCFVNFLQEKKDEQTKNPLVLNQKWKKKISAENRIGQQWERNKKKINEIIHNLFRAHYMRLRCGN